MIQNKLFLGWGLAFFSVLVLWGINNVVLGYAAQILHANFLVYTCSAFASSALFLLLIGGRGPLVRETLRSVDTWAFGLIMLLGYVLTLALFSYVTSTEGSLLQRISMLFSIILSWLFLSRKPSVGQLAGLLVVFAGIAMVCSDLPEKNKGIIYVLMFLEGLALTARMFVAEIHRPHQHASVSKDPRARARVVGFVMFIISSFFFVILFMVAGIQFLVPGDLNIPILPRLEEFRHAPSIFAGLIAGVFLLAPLRLIEFYSANLIKTENFLAVAALSSVATLFWEWLLQPLTGMSLKSISWADFMALGVITLGALVAALSQVNKTRKDPAKEWGEYLSYQSQNLSAVQDTREMVANTLEHYQGSSRKAAKALEIPESVVHALLRDKDQVLAFKPDLISDVSRLYRQNVAMSDPLTGLPNRSSFMMALRNAENAMDQFAVMFIDLNKFKPVNDTYGHEAGDVILKGIAKRLQSYLPAQTVLTRLGGDEYCILLPDKDRESAKKIIPDVLSVIEQNFDLDGVETPISVSASIGVSSYPLDAQNAEELLDKADKAMYSAKGEGDR